MNKLLAFLALAVVAVGFMVVRQSTLVRQGKHSFVRKAIELTSATSVKSLVGSPDFDRIELSPTATILYSAVRKQVRIYQDSSYRMQSEIPLPSSAVTLVGGQVLNDALYLLDYKYRLYQTSLTTLATRTRAFHQIKFDRAILVNDSTILTKQTLAANPQNESFVLYNLKSGRKLNEFAVLPKNNDYGFNTDGAFSKDSNIIYFKCYLNSRTYCFNGKGEYQTTFSEINGVDKKYAVTNQGGNITFSEPIKPLTVAIATHDTNLYVYSAIAAANDHDGREYIDIYSPRGGYLHSLSISTAGDGAKILGFALRGEVLYILRHDRIETHALPRLSGVAAY